MKKFIWKGETNKGYVYEFRVDGEIVVISSNAARYEDAITAADLPKDAFLVSSSGFPIYDGKRNKEKYTDIIWAVRGSLPSGKEMMEYLIEQGAITEEQAKAILVAPEVRLDGGAI